MDTKEQITALSKRHHENAIKHDMLIKAKTKYEEKRIKERMQKFERLTFSDR